MKVNFKRQSCDVAFIMKCCCVIRFFFVKLKVISNYSNVEEAGTECYPFFFFYCMWCFTGPITNNPYAVSSGNWYCMCDFFLTVIMQLWNSDTATVLELINHTLLLQRCKSCTDLYISHHAAWNQWETGCIHGTYH